MLILKTYSRIVAELVTDKERFFFHVKPAQGCSSPEVASSTAESEEQQKIWLWQQLAAHITPTVQRVVEFAKRVPGKIN